MVGVRSKVGLSVVAVATGDGGGGGGNSLLYSVAPPLCECWHWTKKFVLLAIV